MSVILLLVYLLTIYFMKYPILRSRNRLRTIEEGERLLNTQSPDLLTFGETMALFMPQEYK